MTTHFRAQADELGQGHDELLNGLGLCGLTVRCRWCDDHEVDVSHTIGDPNGADSIDVLNVSLFYS